MSSFDGRYAFIADWYDPNAALTRKYQLFYYPSDSTVEMVSLYFTQILYQQLCRISYGRWGGGGGGDAVKMPKGSSYRIKKAELHTILHIVYYLF